MKKRGLIMLILASLMLFAACNTPDDQGSVETPEQSESETEFVPTVPVPVVADGASEYKIISNRYWATNETKLVTALKNDIEDKTGVKLTSSTGNKVGSGKEIVVGNVSSSVVESYLKSIDYNEYVIAEKDEKVYITAHTPKALEAAIDAFMTDYVDDEKNTVTVLEDMKVVGSVEDGLELGNLKEGVINHFDYEGTNIEYGIILPDNYDPNKSYPYFIYVHGHGYGGGTWDNFVNDTLKNRVGNVLKKVENRDCIVLVPHLKIKDGVLSFWANIHNIQYASIDFDYAKTPPSNNIIDLYTLIREVGNTLKVDEKRVYISGASDGAYCTWELITRFNDYFTAAVPLCGGTDCDEAAKVLKDFPVWFFHGTADDAVNIKAATNIDAAFKAVGSKTYKYTPLSGLGHGISDAAYNTSGLWDWLFSQSK